MMTQFDKKLAFNSLRLTDGTPESEFHLIRLERQALRESATAITVAKGANKKLEFSFATLPADAEVVSSCVLAIVRALGDDLSRTVEMFRSGGTYQYPGRTFDGPPKLLHPKDAELIDLSKTSMGKQKIDESIAVVSKTAAVLVTARRMNLATEILVKDALLVAESNGLNLYREHFNVFAPTGDLTRGLWLSLFRVLQTAGVLGLREGASGRLKYPIIAQ